MKYLIYLKVYSIIESLHFYHNDLPSVCVLLTRASEG